MYMPFSSVISVRSGRIELPQVLSPPEPELREFLGISEENEFIPFCIDDTASILRLRQRRAASGKRNPGTVDLPFWWSATRRPAS